MEILPSFFDPVQPPPSGPLRLATAEERYAINLAQPPTTSEQAEAQYRMLHDQAWTGDPESPMILDEP